MKRAALLALWVGSVGAASGCSVITDSERVQCSTNADCVARGAAFAGTECRNSFCEAASGWACLDGPAPPEPTGSGFTVSFLTRETVSQQPLVGLKAKLCRKLDVECADAGTVATSDSQGIVTLKVAPGFDGYVRFDDEKTVPGLFFFNPPVAQDLSNISISLSSFETVAGLAALTGATQSIDRGIVLLSVVDCTGAPAAGVALSSDSDDPQERTFYSANGFPSATATETGMDGYGGLVNVSPGPTTLSASLVNGGRRLDRVTVLVQAGAQSMTTLVPSGR